MNRRVRSDYVLVVLRVHGHARWGSRAAPPGDPGSYQRTPWTGRPGSYHVRVSDDDRQHRIADLNERSRRAFLEGAAARWTRETGRPP